MQVTSPTNDAHKQQIVSNQLLTDTVQIQVYSDYAFSVSAPFFDFSSNREEFSTKALLLSPQAELALHFNHLDSIQYQLVNATQVKMVNQTGNILLQSGDVLESASLVIQRDIHKTGLLQHFSYAIHVDKVRYLSLELETNSDSKFQQPQSASLQVFPIGSELTLIVNFYDKIGRRFDAVKSNIKWSLSRNDIITVMGDDNALQIRSLRQGSVVLSIQDRVNNIQQFFKINVGSIIEPHSDPLTLQVSDIVCFRTKIDSEEDVGGLWFLESSKHSVGHVSPSRGTFVALNVGKSLLVFNHSFASGLSTYSSLLVKPLESVTLDIAAMDGITTTTVLKIPILTSSKQKITGNGCSSVEDIQSLVRYLRANRLLPFTCDVWFENSSVSPLWSAQLQYSVSRGGWVCVLTPSADLDLDRLSLYNLNVTVTVMHNLALSNEISSIESNDPLSTFHQVQLPFLPAFHTSIKQVILTSDSNQVRFTVNSVQKVLKELTIQSSNEDILEVQKLIAADQQNDNSLRVAVILRNADIFSNDVSNLHITLISSLTNQTERISVQIKLYGTLNQLPAQIYSKSFFFASTYLLLTALLAIVIFFLIKRAVLGKTTAATTSDMNGEGFLSLLGLNRSVNSPTSSSRRGKFFAHLFWFLLGCCCCFTVIDYQNSPPSAQIDSRARLLSRTSTTPTTSAPASPGSPRSPRVGRPLYSTRQYVLQ